MLCPNQNPIHCRCLSKQSSGTSLARCPSRRPARATRGGRGCSREANGSLWLEFQDLDPDQIIGLIAAKTPLTVTARVERDDMLCVAPMLKWNQTFRLNEDTTVPAVLLAAPHEIIRSQRRNAFRVPVTKDDDAALRVWKLNEYVLLRDRPQPSQELKVELLDLSVGGARMRVFAKGTEALRLVANQRLRLDLRIGKTEITFEGRIRYPVATKRDDETVIIGVSFEQVDKDVDSRRNRSLLERYLGELQRNLVRRIHRAA
ncbi:MAG: PilZ domain-containing protein [Tepidisphaeraceae bacterium]